MALQTTTTIKTGELVIHNFSHLKIVQKIHAHHTFSFEIGQELLETKFQSNVPASRNLKGQRISIEIKAIPELDDVMLIEDKNDYTLQFYGIIDKVRMRKSTLTDNEQVLVITGHSETILLDNGADCNSFTGMTLEQIVNQVKSRYGIDFHVRPFYKDIIPYTVQYNESDFDFLNRLSKLHAQWFYSNGRTIVLGTPSGFGASPTLVYDVNMQDFIYDMKLVPALFKTIENDNRTGESFIDETGKYGKEANGFHQEYLSTSNQIFSKENVIQLNQNGIGGSGKSALREYTKNKMRSIMGDMMKIKVISEVPGVTLGNTVTIKGVDKQLETSYRITEITHTCDDSGGYENHFKAVNLSGAVYSPKTNPDLIPYSPSQSAIVVSTDDPDGLSAVMVQMPWQKLKGTTTPYIPVLQQYGGSNKGSHWIPEIGETVYVEFQGGNAEMPIVTGSLTSIKEKSGYSTPNN
ncbi:MAG: contractile injection system protein, VgrG/Pvc8 family, partial [Flavobacterium sp.]